MIRRAAIVFLLLFFAFGVLGTSILRTTAPQYAFSQELGEEVKVERETVSVEYVLPYPGILPDHFLWPLKAIRDRIWLFLTTDPAKKADLLLLFADKRIGAAKALVEGRKFELGVSTATKAEKYLERAAAQEKVARERGVDTGPFLEKLASATLKHRELLEEIYTKVPEDARPIVTTTSDYPKRLWGEILPKLQETGRTIPVNPFE